MIYEQGKEYWTIANRFHRHRHTSSVIGPTAVRDMQRLQQRTTSKPVLRRIAVFIGQHQPKPTGPTVA